MLRHGRVRRAEGAPGAKPAEHADPREDGRHQRRGTSRKRTGTRQWSALSSACCAALRRAAGAPSALMRDVGNEVPPDRRLPVRGDPLRGQGSPASRLHLSLHGMSAPDRQCVFNGAGCGRRRLPTRGDPAAPAPTQSRQRAGTLDDTPWPRPTAHFWTRSAQPWVVLPEEDQRFRDATGGPRLDASRLGVRRSRFVPD